MPIATHVKTKDQICLDLFPMDFLVFIGYGNVHGQCGQKHAEHTQIDAEFFLLGEVSIYFTKDC